MAEEVKKLTDEIKKNDTWSDTIKKGIENIKEKGANLKEEYYKKTPIKWRKIGDSILIVGTTASTVAALLSLSPYIVAGAAVITALGKILTNFTSD